MYVTARKFQICRDMDYEHLLVSVGKMKNVLEAFYSEMFPVESYTIDNLKTFCLSLVENQREDQNGLNFGSWAVAPEPENVSEEDAMDFIYFPSVIGVALLSFYYMTYRDTLSDDEACQLIKALEKGIEFAIEKDLNGYAFNSEFQKLESIIIFCKGKVFRLLEEKKELSPKLAVIWNEFYEQIKKARKSGNSYFIQEILMDNEADFILQNNS